MMTDVRPPTKRTLIRAYAMLMGVPYRSVWSAEDIDCGGSVSYTFSVTDRGDIPAITAESWEDWNLAREHMRWELMRLIGDVVLDSSSSTEHLLRASRALALLA